MCCLYRDHPKIYWNISRCCHPKNIYRVPQLVPSPAANHLVGQPQRVPNEHGRSPDTKHFLFSAGRGVSSWVIWKNLTQPVLDPKARIQSRPRCWPWLTDSKVWCFRSRRLLVGLVLFRSFRIITFPFGNPRDVQFHQWRFCQIRTIMQQNFPWWGKMTNGKWIEMNFLSSVISQTVSSCLLWSAEHKDSHPLSIEEPAKFNQNLRPLSFHSTWDLPSCPFRALDGKNLPANGTKNVSGLMVLNLFHYLVFLVCFMPEIRCLVKPKPEARTLHRLLPRHRLHTHPDGAKRERWTPGCWEISSIRCIHQN